MPWRNTSDPYFIWLSEIILQQTRVEQGMPYYLKFTQKFPTVQKLAWANQDEILNIWQGLGYYSRARNMHAAAIEIVNLYKGKFPKDYTKIRGLKGVGDYTAAAISSFAFKLPFAVVDGNVYRVLSRFYKESTPIDSSTGKKLFAQLAQDNLDKKNPDIHNQAIMELGALICTPKKPQCDNCPLQIKCLAFADHSQRSYPVKSKKIAARERYFNYAVVTDGKNIVLKKRGDGDIWSGLYDFRLVESESDSISLPKAFKAIKASRVYLQCSFIHILSHQKIKANFWLIQVEQLKKEKGEQIVSINDLEDFPMPQLLIRYLKESSLL